MFNSSAFNRLEKELISDINSTVNSLDLEIGLIQLRKAKTLITSGVNLAEIEVRCERGDIDWQVYNFAEQIS